MKFRDWTSGLAVFASALVASSLLGAESSDVRLAIAAGEKPLRIEANVRLSERSLTDAWDAAFQSLFAWHDRDDDGRLSEAEAARLPSAYALREVLGIGFTPKLGAAPPFAELDGDKNGHVGVVEMSAWYRAKGLGAPVVGVGVLPHRAALNAALVKLLDADGDGKVTGQELDRAASAIEKFDRNSDELIGAGELVAGVLYPGASGSHLLTPGGSRPPVLEKSPIRLVTDGNDPDWRLQIACATGKAPLFSMAGNQAKPAQSLVKVLPGLQIVLRGDAGQLGATSTSFRERLVERFEDDDTNDDKLLGDDELKIDQANNLWSSFLPLVDRDANQQIAQAELNRWLDLQEQIAQCHVLISVLDSEQGLFELLDETRDGALSAHELRGAQQKLTNCGAFDGKALDLAKLPRVVLITVSHGYPRSPLGSSEQTGPAWFLAMDRNQDGEVSHAEFVGPAEIFRKLDADSSGTLSAAEVERERPGRR